MILVSVFFGILSLWVIDLTLSNRAVPLAVCCGWGHDVTDVSKHWYIVHTYSGFEKKVRSRSSSGSLPTAWRTRLARC